MSETSTLPTERVPTVYFIDDRRHDARSDKDRISP